MERRSFSATPPSVFEPIHEETNDFDVEDRLGIPEVARLGIGCVIKHPRADGGGFVLSKKILTHDRQGDTRVTNILRL